ncbi:GtrA family protein [Candidatus Kaiserbacteria bacterium]|nr:GtrA family protein [Candidatus Kaiserbacteria bacterium]
MRLPNVLGFSTPRMLLAGWVSTGVAYVVYVVLVNLGMHYQTASMVNFMVYWIINFSLHRLWTFKSSGRIRRQVVAHFVLHFANQLLIMLGLFFLVEWLGMLSAYALLIMQGVTTIIIVRCTPAIFKRK